MIMPIIKETELETDCLIATATQPITPGPGLDTNSDIAKTNAIELSNVIN